jgi:regulator of replication initiation timing
MYPLIVVRDNEPKALVFSDYLVNRAGLLEAQMNFFKTLADYGEKVDISTYWAIFDELEQLAQGLYECAEEVGKLEHDVKEGDWKGKYLEAVKDKTALQSKLNTTQWEWEKCHKNVANAEQRADKWERAYRNEAQKYANLYNSSEMSMCNTWNKKAELKAQVKALAEEVAALKSENKALQKEVERQESIQETLHRKIHAVKPSTLE